MTNFFMNWDLSMQNHKKKEEFANNRIRIPQRKLFN